jgi:hypothetical protein
MKFSRRAVVEGLVTALVLIGAGFVVVYPGGRRLAGDFRLIREGDAIYKLEDTSQPENQLGNTGAVVRIGWDQQHILVERLASPTQGTPWSHEAGWVVIDLDQRIVSPTLTETELKQRKDVAHIVTYTPDSAYEMGHWW